MKFRDVKNILRAAALMTFLAAVTALPAAAQNTNTRSADRTETTRVVEREDDTDWGWLGLLGLLGLAGLLPKKRTVEVQEFRDTAQGRPASGAGTVH